MPSLPYLIDAALFLLLLGAGGAALFAHSKLNSLKDKLKKSRNRRSRNKRRNSSQLSNKLGNYEKWLGEHKQTLKEHDRKLNECKERLGEIEDYLKEPAQQQYGRRSPQDRAAGSSSGTDPASEQATGRSVIECYNQALRDDAVRSEFESTYNPARVGVVNSEDRVKNADAPPVFGEESSGDYWLVQHEGTHLAMPRLGLVLQDAHRSTGAMDRVFQCNDRDRGKSYEVARLETPARLLKTPGGTWELEREGKIELRRYD